MNRASRVRAIERVARVVLGSAAASAFVIAAGLIAYVAIRGARYVNWAFLTEAPRKFMTEGGIYPVIVGTVSLVFWTALFSLPVGIMAGVYLSEYAPRNLLTRMIRLAIANMAGVPSIVYGLFGVALFVIQLGLDRSILAGSLTLACLTLPVIITATEESLRQVPQELRHASLALGASKLRTIVQIVLPAAGPGVITGSILGLSRAAGETAPILFTAVAFFAPTASSPLSETMALPYHLYIMATQATKPAPNMVWGTAFVLVAGVSVVNAVVAFWRAKSRRRMKW